MQDPLKDKELLDLHLRRIESKANFSGYTIRKEEHNTIISVKGLDVLRINRLNPNEPYVQMMNVKELYFALEDSSELRRFITASFNKTFTFHGLDWVTTAPEELTYDDYSVKFYIGLLTNTNIKESVKLLSSLRFPGKPLLNVLLKAPALSTDIINKVVLSQFKDWELKTRNIRSELAELESKHMSLAFGLKYDNVGQLYRRYGIIQVMIGDKYIGLIESNNFEVPSLVKESIEIDSSAQFEVYFRPRTMLEFLTQFSDYF